MRLNDLFLLFYIIGLYSCSFLNWVKRISLTIEVCDFETYRI